MLWCWRFSISVVIQHLGGSGYSNAEQCAQLGLPQSLRSFGSRLAQAFGRIMDTDLQDAKVIWNNGEIPVVLRRGGSNPVRVRVPFSPTNRDWLKNGPRKREPVWNKGKKYWELPASRFNELVKMILNRYGKVYIIQPYREKEVCSPSCIEATGFECQCSCLGANHGSGSHQGWYEVTEALALRFGETKLGCRLLERI